MSIESDYYELVTKKILENLRYHLGFDNIQGKKKYAGKSGGEWEIDASCYRKESDTWIIVECRRKTTRRIPQNEIGDLIFRIGEIGGDEGLMVTPVGYQEGARIISEAYKISMATLNPDATENQYILNIAGQLFRGLHVDDHATGRDDFSVEHRTCDACGNEQITNNGQSFFCPACEDKGKT